MNFNNYDVIIYLKLNNKNLKIILEIQQKV